MELNDQVYMERVIDDLLRAAAVCDGVDYSNEQLDYQKQAPFIVGYSRQALTVAAQDLKNILRRYA